jgi:aspartate-semialdehyde dehydrogenase
MEHRAEGYTVAVVGATGLVGSLMVRILEERRFPVKRLIPLATVRSAGRKIRFQDQDIEVREIKHEAFQGVDLALFAGTEGEKGAAVAYAGDAIHLGCLVIDNGNDFRLDPEVPLIVPEVNPEDIQNHKGLIANPNCSTIQMVVALKPLYDLSRITRVVVATYQSVSGAGGGAVQELQMQGESHYQGRPVPPPTAFEHPILLNLFPAIGSFSGDGFTTEEWKMVVEARKIMHDPGLAVSATAVRVPVMVGHSEAIYLETERKISVQEAKAVLERAPGVVVVDGKVGDKMTYPMPKDAAGKDSVFVGRIREDPFVENGLHLWVVSDNLRKGAATNAVQIAERAMNVSKQEGGTK